MRLVLSIDGGPAPASPVRITSTHKSCSMCGRLRRKDFFLKSKTSKCGLGPWCKTCRSTYHAARYQQTKES